MFFFLISCHTGNKEAERIFNVSGEEAEAEVFGSIDYKQVYAELENGDKELITGRVVKIADGDSFTLITPGKEQVRIRILGIDAPERGQAYSSKSRKLLSDLIFNKHVSVFYSKKDRYDRILGDVFVGDIWVNAEMIKRGLAWQYKYSRDRRLERLEKYARSKRLGMWKDTNNVDPWKWRKQHRNKVNELSQETE